MPLPLESSPWHDGTLVEPRFAPVDRALDALRSGQAIVVVDDEKRENEGIHLRRRVCHTDDD
ncbi:MAG UNVERIFIED_CONTAM: hypothetical protein LVR29_18395 [Microcystis novacekii LVE1205-3]